MMHHFKLMQQMAHWTVCKHVTLVSNSFSRWRQTNSSQATPERHASKVH